MRSIRRPHVAVLGRGVPRRARTESPHHRAGVPPHGRFRPVNEQPDRFDQRMRRAMTMPYLVAALLSALFANTPALSEGVDRTGANLVALAGLGSPLMLWYFPWRRFPRNMFLVTTLSATGLTALIVYYTGGVASPFDAYFFLIVIFASLYYTRGTAMLTAGAVFLSGLAPLAYDQPTQAWVLRQVALGASYLLTVWVQNLTLDELLRRERDGEALAEQARTDALTGLPNHRALMEGLDRELGRARRSGRPLSLLFIDADHFKEINDTSGHHAGDLVLCGLGRLLAGLLRTGDLLGRYGGEEFVVILPEADADEALEIGERLRAAAAAHPFGPADAPGLRVTVSVGGATCRGVHCSSGALLRSADEALYRAKHEGRDRVRYANAGWEGAPNTEGTEEHRGRREGRGPAGMDTRPTGNQQA